MQQSIQTRRGFLQAATAAVLTFPTLEGCSRTNDKPLSSPSFLPLNVEKAVQSACIGAMSHRLRGEALSGRQLSDTLNTFFSSVEHILVAHDPNAPQLGHLTRTQQSETLQRYLAKKGYFFMIADQPVPTGGSSLFIELGRLKPDVEKVSPRSLSRSGFNLQGASDVEVYYVGESLVAPPPFGREGRLSFPVGTTMSVGDGRKVAVVNEDLLRKFENSFGQKYVGSSALELAKYNEVGHIVFEQLTSPYKLPPEHVAFRAEGEQFTLHHCSEAFSDLASLSKIDRRDAATFLLSHAQNRGPGYMLTSMMSYTVLASFKAEDATLKTRSDIEAFKVLEAQARANPSLGEAILQRALSNYTTVLSDVLASLEKSAVKTGPR